MSHQPKVYLTKRSNGYFYIGYIEAGRVRWKSTGSKLKSDAHEAISDFKAFISREVPEKLLSAYFDEFLKYAEGVFAPRNLLIYRSAIRNFLRSSGDCAFSSLTLKHFDTYKTVRLNSVYNEKGETKQTSPVTVNIELRALKAALNVAVRWGLLEGNPFSQGRMAITEEKIPTYFTKADFQTLINKINEGWLREVVMFAVLTGMRRGEIINLRWEDVDLSRKLICIQSNPTFKTKQGKKRVVPMSDVVFNLLSSKAQSVRSEYIFHLKGFKINDDHASKQLKKAVREAGLNGKLHFHSLRHTFASWLVQDGVSLYEVQKLLGHSNIAVTQVYSHLQPEGLHSTVNRISVPLN